MNPFRRFQALHNGEFVFRVMLLLMLACVFCDRGYAQIAGPSVSKCKIDSRAARTGFWTWRPGSRVTVYILQNNFTSEEIPNLIKPIELWDEAWQRTGSRVRITYAGITSTPLECENCLTILRFRVYNARTRHGSEVEAHGIIGTRTIKYATIAIDPKLTNSKKLAHAVAHEIGHTFGLLDCYDCKNGSTVMLKLSSVSNDLEGPTACDIAQVTHAYKEFELRPRPAPVALAQEDEGEEPVPDDSPLVVPLP